MRSLIQSPIVSEGFKGGTRGSPIMPRDVSLSNSKCLNGGHEWAVSLIKSPDDEGEGDGHGLLGHF